MADKPKTVPVVIKATFELLYEMPNEPQYLTKDHIEFMLNESSACMSRLVEQLYAEEKAVGENQCFTCHRQSSEFVRLATEADVERLSPTKGLTWDGNESPRVSKTTYDLMEEARAKVREVHARGETAVLMANGEEIGRIPPEIENPRHRRRPTT